MPKKQPPVHGDENKHSPSVGSASNYPSSPIGTTEIEQVLLAISDLAETKPARVDKGIVKQVVAHFSSAPDELERLSTIVFPNGLPQGVEFYKRLYRIAEVVGYSGPGARLIGQVWVCALKRVSESECETLLRLFPECGHSFFVLLNALPVVLSGFRLSPGFTIQFIFDLRIRVGTDLVNGGLWLGIEAWGSSFPEDAFAGLQEALMRPLDDDAIAIAAALLGSLRVRLEGGCFDSTYADAIEKLKVDPDVAKRLVYHRSWINMGWIRGLSHDEFKASLTRMANGTSEEMSEAFNFVRCLLPSTQTPCEAKFYGIEWLQNNAKPTLPDQLKHHVISAVCAVWEEFSMDDSQLRRLLSAMVGVLPIPMTNKGTWEKIEAFLVDLLHKQRPQFENCLLALVDADAKSMMKNFSEHGRFEHLCSEMLMHDGKHIAAKEFFSTLRHRRELAFTLFDEVSFDSFPDGLLVSVSDDEVALCLLEARLHHLEPENTLNFYMALMNRAEQGSPSLRQLFRDELLYQAKNLPGAVLDTLKSMPKPSAMVQEVVSEAENYFERLRATYRSAINSMEIPGWKRALSIQGRRQSKEIEAHSDEFSVFTKLCSTSYCIYGQQGFRYCQDGFVGELSKMQDMSVSMELPRLDTMDPEGRCIRRHDTIRAANRLAKVIKRKKEVQNDA